ncbi:MAG: hypothetical protein AAB774_01390 [Patescibacteria group bacterium]
MPVTGSIDIKPVEAIINHPFHQKSNFRKQLGLAHVAYPGAQHMRGEHELGTYELAAQRGLRLQQAGRINGQDIVDSKVHGLVHDDSHGPYSHITDWLVSNGHNERATQVVQEMTDCILASGANPERIIHMILKQDPLGQLVSHPLLGVDKLDYLARDSYHTGINGMLDIGPFLDRVDYIDGKIVVDAEIYQLVLSLLNHFWTMYDQVYFLDRVVIVERFVQRMISGLLGQTGEEQEITEEGLLSMVDSQLDVALQSAKNPVIRKHYQRYLDGDVPVAAIVYQFDPYYRINWDSNGRTIHQPASDEVFAERMRKPQLLHLLERELEQALGLPKLSILVTPAAPKRRFEPPEIYFQTNSGVLHMRELDSLEWSAAQAKARRHARFYIAVDCEHQQRIVTPSAIKEVTDIVHRHAQA